MVDVVLVPAAAAAGSMSDGRWGGCEHIGRFWVFFFFNGFLYKTGQMSFLSFGVLFKGTYCKFPKVRMQIVRIIKLMKVFEGFHKFSFVNPCFV